MRDNPVLEDQDGAPFPGEVQDAFRTWIESQSGWMARMDFDGTSDPPAIIGIFVGEQALEVAKMECQYDSMMYTPAYDERPPLEDIAEDDRLEWERERWATTAPTPAPSQNEDWTAGSGSIGTYVVTAIEVQHG